MLQIDILVVVIYIQKLLYTTIQVLVPYCNRVILEKKYFPRGNFSGVIFFHVSLKKISEFKPAQESLISPFFSFCRFREISYLILFIASFVW